MANNQIVIHKRYKDSIIWDAVAPAGLENGNIVVLGARGTNGTFTTAANAAITDLGMVMVLPVPLSYAAEKVQNDYVIATGDLVRAYQLHLGFEVSIPQSNITATAALTKEYKVVPAAAALEMECKATAGGTESVVFNIDRLYTLNGVLMATLRCIKSN